MDGTRFSGTHGVVGLLLVASLAGFAWTPGAVREPPFHATPASDEGATASSQPLSPDDGATTAPAVQDAAEGRSSRPLLPDGSPAGEAPSTVLASPREDEAIFAALSNLRISGTALKPRNSNATYVPTGGGGCFYATASAYTIFNIGVFLPQDSWVDTLRMYYNDTSATNSSAWFSVYDLYGQLVQEWGVSSSGSTGNGFNDTGLISHTIDYSQYSYAINWRPYVLGAEMQNCGFRIFYQEPRHFGIAVPLVQRDHP